MDRFKERGNELNEYQEMIEDFEINASNKFKGVDEELLEQR